MPNYDESTMYTMEAFKYMNKKMDIYINKLGLQGRFWIVVWLKKIVIWFI